MSIRFTLIYASLFIVGLLIIVFLIGPFLDLPFDTEKGEHIQVMQIAIPTFISYLSAAVTYATVRTEFPEPVGERGKILRTITVGSLAIFMFGFAVATTIFYFSGRGIRPNSMSYQQYTIVITFLLGILGATTSAISVYVFASMQGEKAGGAAEEQ